MNHVGFFLDWLAGLPTTDYRFGSFNENGYAAVSSIEGDENDNE